MLFLFQVTVRKPAEMSTKEFYGIWEKEAEAVGEGLKAGVLKAAYKVAGEPKVVAIVDAESHDQMDAVLLSLPLWKNYAHMVEDVTWTPLRDYGNWHTHLKELSKG